MKHLLSIGIIIAIISISIIVVIEDMHPPLNNSFETVLTMIGKPAKTLDRSFTKLIGVSVNDERELGDLLSKDYFINTDTSHPKFLYVNRVIQQLAAEYNPKSLEYRVFIQDGPANAFSLPGGIIIITNALLEQLVSEAELVAILGHEKGHIDLGHCIDLMRIEAKRGHLNGRDFITEYLQLIWHYSFSKNMEKEADQYAFETLISQNYAPEALMRVHEMFLNIANPTSPSLLEDYFKSHPASEIRVETWSEKAKRWHHFHPEKKMYQGRKNYRIGLTRSMRSYQEEWQ